MIADENKNNEPIDEQTDPARNYSENASESKTDEVPKADFEEQEVGKDEEIVLERRQYEKLKEKADERDEYLDRLRRSIAENMNLQNRMQKLRENSKMEATREVARKIVPLADSLSRALENAENTEGAEAICEGLELTQKEFYQILEELDIEPINALGEQFDPDYHDAVYQVPDPHSEPNTVVGEIKKGFLISGKLLRPSQVVVASAAPENNEA